MKNCPLGYGTGSKNECSAHCEWFDDSNNGCITRTIAIELIRINEGIKDATLCDGGRES